MVVFPQILKSARILMLGLNPYRFMQLASDFFALDFCAF
jgi:hypothetical protein